MKKISQYCATAALAVGLVTAGVQAGNAKSHSLGSDGGKLSSAKEVKVTTPQLGHLIPNRLDETTPAHEGVQVAGKTGKYIALGVGAAILGSALTSHHYHRGYGYNRGYYYGRPYRRTYYRGRGYYAPRWANRKCARRYKSFDWYSGTYVTYSGRIRLCPYLY